MTSLTKHRIAGGAQLFLGMFLVADGFYPLLFRLKSNPFTWVSAISIFFGLLLAAMGVYCLLTGTLLSRWRGAVPAVKGPRIPQVPPRPPPKAPPIPPPRKP